MKPKLSPPDSRCSRDFVTSFLNLHPTFAWLRWAKLLSFIFCLFALYPAPPALSQIPQGFNYQAIVRDGVTKQPIESQPVLIRVTIEDGIGTDIYQETHSLFTNEFGIISIIVGQGTPWSTSDFDEIDWNDEPLNIKTELQYPVGGSYTEMGTAPLMSVPYAMVADSLSRPLSKLAVTGETTDMEEALFEVRNRDGHIVFAVYNEGVRIYVSDGDAKGPKGGFAIGGFGLVKQDDQHYFFVSGDSIRAYIDSTSTKGVKGGFAIGGFDYTKGKPQDYMKVTRDSVRIYLDANPATKGPKGGFAIGGFDYTKAEEEEYLRVTRDSTRVYVNEDQSKGVKGGFAIGGIGATPGSVTTYTSLTPENYLIGHKSGSLIKNGLYNSFFGYEAGMNNTDGFSNIFIGYRTGYQNTTGGNNVIIGNGSGYFNQTGDLNVIIGNRAGYSGTNGYGNVIMGDSAGLGNTSDYNVFIGKGTGLYNNGKYNSFMGYEAGMYNSEGTYNVFLGFRSGRNNTIGSYNTFMGYQAGSGSATQFGTGNNNIVMGYNAGMNLTSGRDNAFLGTEAGYSVTTGFENTFIGKQAGYSVTTGNSNVAIGYLAGNGITTSDRNTCIGESSGELLTTGRDNAFFGTYSGRYALTGNRNTYIGYDCGYQAQGTANTFLGFQAGRGLSANHLGDSCVFLGHEAGYNATGSNKLIITNWKTSTPLISGDFKLKILTINGDLGIRKDSPVLVVSTSEASGTDAVIRIGGARTTSITDDLSRIEFYNYESGGPFELARISARNGDAISGTGHGHLTFQVNNGSGLIKAMYIANNGNVSIGAPPNAAKLNISATGNGAAVLALSIDRSWIFEQEGTADLTALRLRSYSGKVFNIDTNGATKWRSSDGNYTYVTITHDTENGGLVGIGDSSPNAALDVVGDIDYTGTLTDVSDITLKKDIVQLSDVLKKIMNIRGVEYSFIDTAKYGSERQTGLIAQELQREFPNLVSEVEDGILGTNSVDFSAVLLEAVKEQQLQIKSQQHQIDELKVLISRMEEKIASSSRP